MLYGYGRGATEKISELVSCTHILTHYIQTMEDIFRLRVSSIISYVREYFEPCEQITGVAIYMQVADATYEILKFDLRHNSTNKQILISHL